MKRAITLLTFLSLISVAVVGSSATTRPSTKPSTRPSHIIGHRDQQPAQNRLGQTPKIKVGMTKDELSNEVEGTGWFLKVKDTTEASTVYSLFSPITVGGGGKLKALIVVEEDKVVRVRTT